MCRRVKKFYDCGWFPIAVFVFAWPVLSVFDLWYPEWRHLWMTIMTGIMTGITPGIMTLVTPRDSQLPRPLSCSGPVLLSWSQFTNHHDRWRELARTANRGENFAEKVGGKRSYELKIAIKKSGPSSILHLTMLISTGHVYFDSNS